MTNRNIIHNGTQTAGLGVMIGWCSNTGDLWHSANVGCSSFRYTNDEQINHKNQRLHHRKNTLLLSQKELYTKRV